MSGEFCEPCQDVLYNSRAIIEGKDEEIDRLRAELAEARKPDCRMCVFRFPLKNTCALDEGSSSPCIGGSRFQFIEPTMTDEPVRLYEKEGEV